MKRVVTAFEQYDLFGKSDTREDPRTASVCQLCISYHFPEQDGNLIR